MLLLVIVLTGLATAVISSRVRVTNRAPLGSMSEQWLASYRASHGS